MSNATVGGREGFQTFKDLLLALIEKEELHFIGWALLGLLLVLIITCCIGCRGCCCRACCGARETRLQVRAYKLPSFGSGSKKAEDRFGHEVALVPINRCCYHPRHCLIDREQPFICDCRRVCTTCTGYFPIKTNCGEDVEQSAESDVAKTNLNSTTVKCKTLEQETRPTSNKTQQHPYHRVEVDKMYVHKPSGQGSYNNQAQPKIKATAPPAPYPAAQSHRPYTSTQRSAAPTPPTTTTSTLPAGAWSYTNSPCQIQSSVGFVNPQTSQPFDPIVQEESWD